MATATETPSGAARFLEQPKRMVIDGECVLPRHGRTFKIYYPALDEVIDHVPAGDAEDIELAVRAALRAFDDSKPSHLTSSERGRLTSRIGDLIFENADELATVELQAIGLGDLRWAKR